ncbi:MBL fold metallo-hydrolase [Pedobacter sp. BS3]|uniref:MBL fold metallo-hydrolase n=1 Tax=Pedobacter sp. BS3 TaxID=2567937 RepID=UPI0011EEE1A4|nr:MBL fold metallo-hydrolase [Pedobacter sp. BS3]TZF84997.1 MBL fold metallo-hydrolase [Pedobacter sp. BS3]
MKITLLGTGTSQGIPVIGCECAVCTSADKRDKRLRVSVLVEVNDKVLVIDSGPDFRYQMLRAGVKQLDGIILTHEHKDHIAGLDDVRAFNYRQKAAMDVYATSRVQDALRREFYYAFADTRYPGVPLINLHEITNNPFTAAGISITPIETLHYMLPVFGFRIGDFTYITDAKTVSEVEREKIRGSKVLVVNALQKEKHISHFTLDEAIAFAQDIGAPKTYFTHISHKLGRHRDISLELPPGIALAYDGLVIEM